MSTQELTLPKIEVWRRRLPLPHAISSTCLIVEAQIHQLQHGETSSSLAMRAMFASALARFVTGFCDINQSAVSKRSMFDVAAELGMPEQWVELRHQITHGGELPILQVLEKAVDGAKDWLWNAFWVKLNVNGDGQMTTSSRPYVSQESVGLELQTVLKGFVNERKAEVKSMGKAAIDSPSKAADDAIIRLFPPLQSHVDGIDLLLSLLLDDSMIIPPKRDMGGSMAGAFTLWDHLLIKLSLCVRSFLPEFIMQILKWLTAVSHVDEVQDSSKEAAELWLEHIFTSKAWSGRRSRSRDGLSELRNEIFKECVLSPGPWTQRLSAALLNSTADSQIKDKWKDTCDAAVLDGHSEEVDDSDDKNGHNMQEDSGAQMDGGALRSNIYRGWRPYPGQWQPVSIGIPQSAMAA